MRRSILVFIVVALAVANGYDWDWMDCIHGTFVNPGQPGTGYCQCYEGWGGVDCNLCQSDDVCGNGAVCDTNPLFIGSYKGYSCHTNQAGLVPSNGSMNFDWYFTDGVGYGVLTTYLNPEGEPFLFNCTFTNCEVAYKTNGLTYVQCSNTSCHCSTWCNLILSDIIKQMKGNAIVIYDDNGVFTLHQDQLPLVLEGTCQAAGCCEGAGCNSSFDCSAQRGCDSCASAGCVWCLDSGACQNSTSSCSDWITRANYCPTDNCNQYTRCSSCTEHGCGWCLDDSACIPVSDEPKACGDVINKPAFCIQECSLINTSFTLECFYKETSLFKLTIPY